VQHLILITTQPPSKVGGGRTVSPSGREWPYGHPEINIGVARKPHPGVGGGAWPPPDTGGSRAATYQTPLFFSFLFLFKIFFFLVFFYNFFNWKITRGRGIICIFQQNWTFWNFLAVWGAKVQVLVVGV
jgi:hypothetical protein